MPGKACLVLIEGPTEGGFALCAQFLQWELIWHTPTSASAALGRHTPVTWYDCNPDAEPVHSFVSINPLHLELPDWQTEQQSAAVPACDFMSRDA